MTGVREAVVAEARAWIGTPYRHQASLRGAGADCLGLLRGVWRAVLGPEPEVPPPYTRDWAEASRVDAFAAAAARHLRPLEPAAAQPGDVLLFRWRDGLPAKHAGILTAPGRFVHAYEGSGVVESPLVPAWRRRLAGAYAFPGADD
ncbi:DUF6950 family protein [Prosthecomicrobium sp. N25]|uniref:DUF6950 family protein n=1 Tax=Prosthecomicrobium sp. N25 TaxID=3129254 RepID=UPI0030772C8D